MKNWTKLIKKSIRRKCQLDLLNRINGDKVLIHTDILTNLIPHTRMEYKYRDLNTMKEEQLKMMKEQFLTLAIKEAERDIVNTNNELKVKYIRMAKTENLLPFQDLVRDTESIFCNLKEKIKDQHKKKIQFHTREDNGENIVQAQTNKRITHKRHSNEMKRAKAKKHRKKKRKKYMKI